MSKDEIEKMAEEITRDILGAARAGDNEAFAEKFGEFGKQVGDSLFQAVVGKGYGGDQEILENMIHSALQMLITMAFAGVDELRNAHARKVTRRQLGNDALEAVVAIMNRGGFHVDKHHVVVQELVDIIMKAFQLAMQVARGDGGNEDKDDGNLYGPGYMLIKNSESVHRVFGQPDAEHWVWLANSPHSTGMSAAAWVRSQVA